MSHERLQALTDGIFAIVMTLLVLELKVPVLDTVNNQSLWHAHSDNAAIFISYLISFMLLFVLWRGHNFLVSTMAKNLNANLVNLNMFFLLLVGLVPFTTHLIGSYPRTQLAIIIYALNIILLSSTLFLTRQYIERSESIEHDPRTREQRINAYIRMSSIIVCATLAIPLCFINPWLGFGIILLAIGFNLLNNAADIFRKVFKIA